MSGITHTKFSEIPGYDTSEVKLGRTKALFEKDVHDFSMELLQAMPKKLLRTVARDFSNATLSYQDHYGRGGAGVYVVALSGAASF
jgi:hypothetical protein